MSKFREFLLKGKETEEAYLIDDHEREVKTKDEYIHNAEEGLIVAFRLNFSAKSGVQLTKVISGKILENNKEDEIYVVETRNGLKYCVPYQSVVWVKTGERWPKGVYDEMKQGSVARKEVEESDSDSVTEFGGLESGQNESVDVN